MDKMTLFSLVLISFPESIFDLFIGFLVIGEKRKLKFNKENFIRLVSASVLMTASSFFARLLAHNLNVSLILTVCAYILVIKLIYGLSWLRSFISVVVFVGTLISIEASYIPEIVAMKDNELQKILSSDMLRLVYSLPERFVQLAIIVTLWNLGVVLLNLKKFRPIKGDATALVLILLTIEVSVGYALLHYFYNMPLVLKIILSVVSVLLIAVNVLVFRLIIRLTKSIELYEVKKTEKSNSLKIITNLIKKNDIESAKKLCENTNKDKSKIG